jgi:hypothetical protein
VEDDGDQSDGFDGTNLEPTGGEGKPGPKPNGRWRIEVEPAAQGLDHRFLNVLLIRQVGDTSPEPEVELLKKDGGVVAVRVGGSLAVFSRDGAPVSGFELRTQSPLECWLLDASPGSGYRLDDRAVSAGAEGVATFEWPRGRHVLRR